MKRVIILLSQSGDWEGLFIDGNLINEAHTLGEGDSRLYLLKMSKKYNFTINDIIVKEVNDEDEEILFAYGCFEKTLKKMKGIYV